MSAETRALARIREAMKDRKLSQRDLAEAMRCSQARIAKILRGRAHLRVTDLERLTAIVGVPLVEAIRNRGAEFFAELTPSELRLLETLRSSPHLQRAVSDLVDAAKINAALSSKRDLRRPKASGKTPSSLREFPYAGHAVQDAASIAALRHLASELASRLAAFASGGRQLEEIPAASSKQP